MIGALCAGLVLGAWQWPVTEFSIGVGFGVPNDESLSPGLELVSSAETVRAAADGELVFAFDAESHRAAIPHALGSFLVLEHHGGLRSVYAHLDRDPEDTALEFAEDDPVGVVGRTGFAGGNTLGFRIIDTERAAYVNPMILLPELEDETAPRIESVQLSRGSTVVAADPDASLPEGPARLSALVYDPGGEGPYRDDAAPYSVTVFANGRESHRLVFETLSRSGERITVSGGYAREDLYDEEGRLQLGSIEIAPGNNLIEIVAEDHVGNERVESIRITGEGEQ
ncbi:MAG: peptidoglycan DD-metalloendopeptidase family protein [Spirochaetaceae bacterium]